jgi:uncharacterized protein (TIGR02466 family)
LSGNYLLKSKSQDAPDWRSWAFQFAGQAAHVTFSKIASDDLVLTFPTPIVKRTIPGAATVNRRLGEIVLERARGDQGEKKSNKGGWQSKPDLLDWPYPEIEQLKRWIADAVKSMTVYTTGKPDITGNLEIMAWANVNRFGDYNKPHSHPGCMWSGVYYIQTGAVPADQPSSGMIEFIDPRVAVEMIVVPGRPFEGRYKVRPEAGMILVFPSWLLHFVNPYLSHDERISVAFNAQVTKIN